MKTNQLITKQIILGTGLLLLAGAVKIQANIYKAATATMSASSDWATTPGGVTAVAPTASVIGEFGSTPSSANLSGMALGGNTSLLGLQFDNNTAGPLTVGAGSTLTLAASGINMASANNNATLNCAVALSASQTWSVNSGLTLTVGGVISGSTFGITKTGPGTLVLSAANTFTGNVTNNAGTLKLDFTAGGAPSANIINSASALKLNGGTVQTLGASGGSSQTFASTAFYSTTSGQSIITNSAISGTIPTNNLGTLTGTAGALVRFDGAAYNSGASSGTTLGGTTVAATGVYNVTANTSDLGLISTSTGGAAGAYATVGLYDWAAVSGGTVGTAQTGTIVGGSQISGFYSTVNSLPATSSYGLNIDLTANATMFNGSGSVSGAYGEVRFNTAGAITLTEGHVTGNSVCGAFLVTPNVGANNTTIAASGAIALQASRSTGAATGLTVWQNNILGEFIISPPIANGSSSAATSTYIQGGPGSVFLNGVNTYTGQNFLDGGYTVISANSGLGAIATGATLNINGGTLFGNGTFTLDNAGANPRPIYLSGAGGTLAAAAGKTMSVDGYINSASGSGPLIIGCGTLPGTGAGTANTTAIVGSGTVNLNGAGNGYSSGTIITGGATAIINSVWALGGGAYGGLTFNNGTLQYAATPLNVALDITEDTSYGTGGTNGGVAKPVTLTGNGTIDVNGNAVVFTNTVGNGGSGALTLASSLPNGSLTLLAPSTYTGGTTVSGGTLNANNSTGSATGTGGVTINGSGILTGTGSISGAVTNSTGGTVSSIGTNSILTLGSLVLNGGNILIRFDAGFHTNGIITLTGGLTLTSGNIQLSIANGTLANGTYRLINCSGTPGGSLSAIAISGFTQSGQSVSLSAVSGGLNLVVGTYVAQNLTWVGNVSGGQWDVNTTSNWDDTTTSVNPWVYNDSDNTIFDNTSANTTVNLVGALTPGSVTVNGTQSYTFTNTGVIGGATALTNNSTGTLTILTANTYTGGTIINSGTVQLGNGTISGAIGTGSVTNNAALVMDSPSRVATGPINGSGNVTVEAGGTLAIGGNSAINTLTLGSSVTNGILDLNNSGLTVGSLAIATGATTCYIGNGGTVAASTLNYNGGSSTFGGVIEDVLGSGTKTVALNVNSSGILTLTAANTYTGGTVINSGQVTLTGVGSLGSGLVTLNNSSTLYENGAYIANTISNAPSAISTLEFNGTGGYYPALNLVGGGTVNLDIVGGTFSPSGSVSGFSGIINLNGGIRASIVTTATTYGSANATWNLGATGNINSKYGNQTVYLGALNGSAGSGLTAGNTSNPGGNTTLPSIFVVGNLNTTSTFAGNITDGSQYTGLTKVGTGLLVLSGGANNYSAPTIVSGGTLEVDSLLGGYTATTNYAGTTLAGTGSFNNQAPVGMAPGSTLAPGVTGLGNYGTLTFTGGLILNGNTNLFDISSSTNDLVAVTGGLTLAGAGTVKLNISGTLPDGTNTLITYDSISGSVTANLNVTPAQVGNQFFTLHDDNAGHIQLIVLTLGTNSLTWIGDGSANYWDTSSINWTNLVGVDDEAFLNGDSVTFNNAGAANSPVNLQLPVSPSGVMVSGSSNYTFNSTSGLGKITGIMTNGLTKTGSGTLTLLITNDFTGPTTINGGVLQVGDGNTPNTGLSAGVITNNALLIFDQTNNNYTVVGNLTGTGSLVQEGSNTVTLAGNTTYAGATVINTGTLQFGNGGTTAFPTNAISLTNSGTVAFDLAGTYAVTNGISGNGWVSFNGPGTNIFGGVNTYANNTAINGGTVKLAGPAVLPVGVTGWTVLDGGSTAGTLDLNGNNQTLNGLSGITGTTLGRIVNNGGTGVNTLTISNWSAPTYAGLILDTNVNGSNGKIALVIAGAGTQTLSGNNNYSGGTTVNYPAKLLIGAATNLGTGMTTLEGGTLGVTANGIYLNGISLTVPSGTNGLIIMTNAMKLPALYGSGTLNLQVNNQQPQNSSSVIGDCLSTCANFGGTLNITGAEANAYLVLNFNNVNGGSFDGNLSGATVNLITGVGGVSLVGMNNSGGNTAQFGALNVDASSALGGADYVATQTYQIGALNTTSVIDGVITNGSGVSGGGPSAITKVGTGKLILNNNGNTYTGKTTVNAGTLQVNGQITASPVTVNSGGILSGTGTLGNVVTNNAGAMLYPGVNGIGQLTLNSNLTLNATSTNLFVVTTAGGVSNTVAVAGLLSPNGSVVEINTGGGQLAAGTYNNLFTYGTTNGTQFATAVVFDTPQSGTFGTITNDGAGHVNLVVSTASKDASLFNLVVNASVSPTFHPGTTNYFATNYNANSSVTVLVTNNSAFATNQLFLNNVSQGLLTNEVTSLPLAVGVGSTNVIRVQVTAQDGLTVSNYFVTVTRLSTNAQLANLVISNGTGALTFYPSPFATTNTGIYYATNAAGAGPVTVTVTVTNVDATAMNTLLLGTTTKQVLTNEIASSGLTLNVGTTNVSVQVVSQDGSQTSTYVVSLTQLGSASSSTTYLTSLVLSNAANVQLPFSPTSFSTNLPSGPYTATNSLASLPLTVTITNIDSNATNTLYVNSSNVGYLTNGLTSSPLTTATGLVEGSNNVTVQTVSQDGSVMNSYTVNVTLQGTNALLTSLLISPWALSQSFSSGLTNYTATNTYPNTNVAVTATSADGNAAVALSFNNGSNYNIPLTNGVASANNALSLSQPANVLAVQVVSQDGLQTNVYTVNALLQPITNSPPHLTNSVSGGTSLVLSWPQGYLGYRLLVQTNNLNKGVSSNKTDWGTVLGSTNITSTNLTIIKVGMTNEYYRLVYP